MTDINFSSTSNISITTNYDLLGTSSDEALSIGDESFLTIGETGLSSMLELLVTRELNSQVDITVFIDSDVLQQTIYFNSTANVVIQPQTTINVERNFNTTIDKIFNGVGTLHAIRNFNSTVDITSQTNTWELIRIWAFNSNPTIQFNLPDFNMNWGRWFNVDNSITVTTSSTIEKFNSFASNVEINFSTISKTDYQISGYKKLEYLTGQFVSPHIVENNPKFKDFMKVFLRYLDRTSINRTLDITKNNNVNTIFPELMDIFMDNYMKDFIDLTKYGLSELNKKKLLLISQMLFNSKGNKKSFDYLFRTLTNIIVASKDLNISIDKIITEFIESESFWEWGIQNYYDHTWQYDQSIYYNSTPRKMFTYQFKINQPRDDMIPLIKAVHPAGFSQEFSIDVAQEDEFEMQDKIKISTTYYHYYSYPLPDRTWWKYDGSTQYKPYHTEIIEA